MGRHHYLRKQQTESAEEHHDLPPGLSQEQQDLWKALSQGFSTHVPTHSNSWKSVLTELVNNPDAARRVIAARRQEAINIIGVKLASAGPFVELDPAILRNLLSAKDQGIVAMVGVCRAIGQFNLQDLTLEEVIQLQNIARTAEVLEEGEMLDDGDSPQGTPLPSPRKYA